MFTAAGSRDVLYLEFSYLQWDKHTNRDWSFQRLQKISVILSK